MLSKGDISTQSPYTGVYEGNNLIMIMLESAEWNGITEELTPTLYALKQQAITSDLYLSKNKTNQSEAISIIGSYPSKTDIQAELESDVKNDLNSYPFALPSILKRDGYVTSYMHNNTETFYNRAKTHKGLGFDNLYFYETVELENQYKTTDDFYDLESDYEFFKAVSKNYSYINPQGNKPFMSFFTTLSMHGNYDDLNNFIKENDLDWDWDYTGATESEREEFEEDTPATNDFLCRYYDKITKEDFLARFGENLDKLGLSEKEQHTSYLRYKQYQAAYMDLDAGINEMLQDLSRKGQLENTTILLFADHDGYYHNQNYTLRGYDKSEYKISKTGKY
jgi:phosphoglycerol transferase MdoB-like AlkP superfamily enzyme